MEYSIIVDGVVIKRLVCDEGFAQLASDNAGGSYTDDVKAQVGYKVVDGKYIPPKAPEVPVPDKRFSFNELSEAETDKLIDLLKNSNVIDSERSTHFKNKRRT